MLSLVALCCLTALAAPAPPRGALAAPAIAPSPAPAVAPDARAVIFVRGANAALSAALVRDVVVPIGEKVELVPWSTFRRAAVKAHLRGVAGIPMAQRLARTL